MERLLTYFTPTNYNLSLNINKHLGAARGRAIITGEPKADVVKLHAKDLTIDRVMIGAPAQNPQNPQKPKDAQNAQKQDVQNSRTAQKTQDGQNPEIVKFTHKADILELPPAQIYVIDYHFKLNTNMEGAYLSSYSHEGKKELLVSTQFESHYARECFPCVDEPAAKATFDLTITVPDADDVVISNMPEKIAQEATHVFETTPKMSTYLLAFCIGRFQKKSKTSKNGHKVTTYCALNQDESSVDFANEIACEALDFYDKKFGTKYPLPKLDQIAIPDFESGAMENWGLVTYRESCLLADKNTTKIRREYIATVIAHELSHQWFGNLVTMKWWNNLWLNESFANLMERLCVEEIRPEYKTLEDYFVSDCVYALNRDALPDIQSVQQEVDDPADIAALFDSAIVYAKGSHLLFMLYRLMGEKNFFAGLKSYFKAHKYANTTGDDLWAALAPHANFDVKALMDAWILQPGYPVITDGTQQRFLLSGATDDTKWPLPEVTDDMSGHYLINLSGPEFDEKIAHFNDLSFEQKARLLVDRQLLSRTSLVSSALHFDLLPKFKDETNDSIWSLVDDLIDHLGIYFRPDDPKYHDYADFQRFIFTLAEPNLKRLGYVPKKGEDESASKLRRTMLSLAVFSENRQALEALAEQYDDDLMKMSPETRRSVLLARLRLLEADDEKTAGNYFDFLLDAYQKTASPELCAEIRSTMGCSRLQTKKLLDLLEAPEIIRPQDHIYHLSHLLGNYKTRKKAQEWTYSHWSYLKNLTGEKSLDDYVSVLGSSVVDAEESARFDEFCETIGDEPGLARSIALAKANIKNAARLHALNDEDVHRRLAEISLHN